MKSRDVVYSATARGDLVRILHWLAENASVSLAVEIVYDIESFIERLDIASERGRLRDDISPGLRMITHKRAEIAVLVDEHRVLITRIFYGGEDWEAAMRPPP
jgi:toxin ParE1/3/4